MRASWRRLAALPGTACSILDPRDCGLDPQGFLLILISAALKKVRESNCLYPLGPDSSFELSLLAGETMGRGSPGEAGDTGGCSGVGSMPFSLVP